MTKAAFAVAGTAILVAILAGQCAWAVAPSSERGGKRDSERGERGGPALIHLKGVVENKSIGPLNVVGPSRIVESSKKLVMRNLRIRGITGLDLQRDGIRLRGDIDGATVQNFRLVMRRQPQAPPHLPTGIAVVSGRRIRISDGEVAGFQMVRIPGKYTNGDGIAAERQVHDLSITRVVSRNNSDAGFDLKSSPTSLDQLRAENNGRNYRFWARVEAGTLTSVEPRGAHVWAGNGAVVHIKRLVARSSTRAPLVQIERGGQVVIDQCELRLPVGTRLVAKSNEGRVVLGRGCGKPR